MKKNPYVWWKLLIYSLNIKRNKHFCSQNESILFKACLSVCLSVCLSIDSNIACNFWRVQNIGVYVYITYICLYYLVQVLSINIKADHLVILALTQWPNWGVVFDKPIFALYFPEKKEEKNGLVILDFTTHQQVQQVVWKQWNQSYN